MSADPLLSVRRWLDRAIEAIGAAYGVGIILLAIITVFVVLNRWTTKWLVAPGSYAVGDGETASILRMHDYVWTGSGLY